MVEEIDTLLVGVRANVSQFASDVSAMRTQLEGSLAAGADKASRAIENDLVRAVRTGKLGFEDLGKVALSVMDRIAAAAVRQGIGSVAGGNSGIGGLLSFGERLLTAALGLPGRASGGPVAPGAAYLVGERGPEIFVPTSSGRVLGAAPGPGAGRDVRVSITVNGPGADAPRALAKSARQVARSVREALGS